MGIVSYENIPEIREFQSYLKLSKSFWTTTKYVGAVRRFFRFIQKPPQDVTLEDIVKFLSRYQSPRSQYWYAYALRSFFEFIGRTELARRIPIARYTQKMPEILSEEEIYKGIRMLTDVKEKAIILTAYECALRIGEVPLLNRSDYIRGAKELRVHRLKGRAGMVTDQILPISDQLCQLLDEYLAKRDDDCEALFVCSYPPKRITVEMVRYIFKKFAKLIGKPHLTFHVLRHSRLTHLAVKGMDLLTLAEFAHHRNPQSTMVYIHLSSRILRERLAKVEQEKYDTR